MKRFFAFTLNFTGDLPTSFGASGTGGDVIDNVRIRDFRLVIGGVPTSYQTSDTVVGTSSITPPDEPISKTSQGATASQVKMLLANKTVAGQLGTDQSDNAANVVIGTSSNMTPPMPDGP